MAELRDVAPRAAAAELYVAADGPDVIGTVTFVPNGGPLGEIATPHEAEFRMLAVDPAARSQGVGTALTRHILDAARARGKAGIVCSTLAEMRAAHRIYERLGLRARARTATGRPCPASTCSRTPDPSEVARKPPARFRCAHRADPPDRGPPP